MLPLRVESAHEGVTSLLSANESLWRQAKCVSIQQSIPPRVAHHVELLCVALQASPFDGDLAKMRAAGLVTEGVGQLIEGEAAAQDGTYPRLFERSDIVLLLAPAANHESLQARLLGQQSDGRPFTLQPGQHAN